MPLNMLVPPNWSAAKQMMYASIYERQAERLEGYEINLVDRFFPLTDLKEPAIIGLFAWTQAQLKRKWLLEKHAVPNAGHWVTPGDLARDYLAIKYANRRARCTSKQYEACVRDVRSTPLYCVPSELEYAYYVDIKSAYWSIVQAVGWDVNYMPGEYIGVQSDVSDFPFADNKMARNSLVSVGLSGTISLWTGTMLKRQKRSNKFINLVLYRLVCDVLNNVASRCIDAGAVYCFTDGYIVPQERLNDVIEEITSWGLPYSIKAEGKCSVRAPGEYYFPQVRTKSIPRRKPHAISKYYTNSASWLKVIFSNWATRRIAKQQGNGNPS